MLVEADGDALAAIAASAPKHNLFTSVEWLDATSLVVAEGDGGRVSTWAVAGGELSETRCWDAHAYAAPERTSRFVGSGCCLLQEDATSERPTLPKSSKTVVVSPRVRSVPGRVASQKSWRVVAAPPRPWTRIVRGRGRGAERPRRFDDVRAGTRRAAPRRSGARRATPRPASCCPARTTGSSRAGTPGAARRPRSRCGTTPASPPRSRAPRRARRSPATRSWRRGRTFAARERPLMARGDAAAVDSPWRRVAATPRGPKCGPDVDSPWRRVAAPRPRRSLLTRESSRGKSREARLRNHALPGRALPVCAAPRTYDLYSASSRSSKLHTAQIPGSRYS